MLDQERVDLAKYRLATALDDYYAASYLFFGNHLKSANSRAYFCVYHSIKAVLALEGKDFKKYSDLVEYFKQNYVENGPFEEDHSKIIEYAHFVRDSSDYDDFSTSYDAETQMLIRVVKIFYDAVKEYVNHQLAEKAPEQNHNDVTGQA